MDARRWLRNNNYEEIAEIIDEIMSEWSKTGKGTRRNWWDVLAGRLNGDHCIIAGRKIPILRAAQIRSGRTISPHAICKNENEQIPQKMRPGRWKEKYSNP